METQSVNMFVAFLAGLVSFLSPCVLPLVPVYIGYLSGPAVMGAVAGAGAGMSAGRGTRAVEMPSAVRWRVMGHATLFVLGFTLIFVVVIGGLAGALSDLLISYKREIQYIMGAMLIIFGLHMLTVINIPLLNYTRRLDVRPAENLGYVRSFLVGMAFGVGWTPCIGPTLGLMFTLVLNGQQAEAFPLFLAYSLGLGIPFLLAGLAMGQVSSGLKRLTRRTYSFKLGAWKVMDHANIVSIVSGVLLIVVGLLVFNNWLTLLNQFAPDWLVGIS